MRIKTVLIAFLGFFLVFLFLPSDLSAQGHFEFGFHYGSWGVDLLKSLIEKGISNGLERGLKDNIMNKVREVRPGIEEVFYSQDVIFDSGKDNWGIEVRWYPKGFGSSFSLGLSMEQTTMRVSVPELSVRLTAVDNDSGKQGTFTGDASGAQFEMKPTSFHLHFRWDIVPQWKVRPFITFGFGIAAGKFFDEGRLTASFSGELQIEGEPAEYYEESIDKTLRELEEEMEEEEDEFFLPPVLPFIQFNFGIKGKLTPNLYLLVETGIFNGFVFRGGLAVRL